MLEDARGSLWIAAPSGLYRRWPDGSAARYTVRDGLPNEYLSDFLEDHEGRLWAGTRLGGFFRFSADATRRRRLSTSSSRIVRRSADLLGVSTLRDLRPSILGRDRRGLVEFFPTADEQGPAFVTYTERNGLSYYDITALNEDLGGNLWLGTTPPGR